MFLYCCENELLAPQQEAALRGNVLMNHGAKSPFLEGIIFPVLPLITHPGLSLMDVEMSLE